VKYTVTFDGSKLYLVRPATAEARAFLEELVSPDSTWFGGALVVEDHYIADLVDGLRGYDAEVHFS